MCCIPAPSALGFGTRDFEILFVVAHYFDGTRAVRKASGRSLWRSCLAQLRELGLVNSFHT